MKKVIITSALILGSVVASQAANVITNGSFEAGMSGNHSAGASSELGNFKFGPTSYGSTLPTGWTKNGDRVWSVTDTAGPDSFPTGNGDYAIRLDAATDGGVDYLSQTNINLTAGTTYTFKIDMWSEIAAGGSDLDAFLVDGAGATVATILDNYVDSVDGLETVTQTFTVAATGTYELRLQNANQTTASNGNHTWVDNVSIEAVPEPSSAALLGLGGLALILRRRK